VLYVSGEESARQVKLRADRLKVSAPNLLVLAETDAQKALHAAEQLAPAAVAIDSIQTQYLPELASAPGTVTQIREVTARLMAYAKTTETPVFLVGHVTKDGAIAGPRVLEHMVDTVLYFEGGGAHPYRVLRAHKNRFGSASEIGVFEMKAGGLAEVSNPSALFLAERPEDAAGSAVTAALNGTRTVLVEIQALVAESGYGTPRRTALGLDGGRVAMLAAVLSKKLGMELSGADIFVNVAGGLTLDDPGADLACAAALASSFRNRPVPARTLLVGEVGLAGEVRVSGPEEYGQRHHVARDVHQLGVGGGLGHVEAQGKDQRHDPEGPGAGAQKTVVKAEYKPGCQEKRGLFHAGMKIVKTQARGHDGVQHNGYQQRKSQRGWIAKLSANVPRQKITFLFERCVSPMGKPIFGFASSAGDRDGYKAAAISSPTA
jgi:hypothetical protein